MPKDQEWLQRISCEEMNLEQHRAVVQEHNSKIDSVLWLESLKGRAIDEDFVRRNIDRLLEEIKILKKRLGGGL
ncbi:hypothetical protein AAIR98_001466 [Elusimicrobium simillimum]|uniref:hypothetical protein n=1 Tax=Elusimicrobium simillimum TaxID=3143438 RepID=UPI003C6EF592